MLSAENAAIDKIQSRLNAPLQEIKEKSATSFTRNTKTVR